MSSDPVKVFPFLFYLQITFETHRRAKRGTHRRAKREREREERVGRVSSGPTPDAAARSSPNLKRNGEIAAPSS